MHDGIPTPPDQTPPQDQTPPGADTPRSRHPLGPDPLGPDTPLGSDTPQEQTPPPPRSRPPGADTPRSRPPPRETATAADGTHTIGMHSCLYILVRKRRCFYWVHRESNLLFTLKRQRSKKKLLSLSLTLSYK